MTRVTITEAENGFTVEVCAHDGDGPSTPNGDKSYVYKTIKEAARELPGIFAVDSEEAKPKVSKQAQIRGEDYE